jgi:hypothetical protein
VRLVVVSVVSRGVLVLFDDVGNKRGDVSLCVARLLCVVRCWRKCGMQNGESADVAGGVTS